MVGGTCERRVGRGLDGRGTCEKRVGRGLDGRGHVRRG